MDVLKYNSLLNNDKIRKKRFLNHYVQPHQFAIITIVNLTLEELKGFKVKPETQLFKIMISVDNNELRYLRFSTI